MAKVDEERIAKAIAAVREATGFEAGAEIKTARLHDALGLPEYPNRKNGESDRAYAKRVERFGLGKIRPVEELRERLLEAHKVDLRATGRGAYRVVPPGVQAERAIEEGLRGARKSMRDGIKRATHVDLAKLTDEQARRRDAALLMGKSYLQMLGGKSAVSKAEKACADAKDSAPTSATMPGMRTE